MTTTRVQAVEAPVQPEAMLVTGNSTIEHLHSCVQQLDNIEGCLFGEPTTTAVDPPRDGIEARSAQAADLAWRISERLAVIYNRL